MGIFASSIGHMPVLYEVLICSCVICTSTEGSILGDELSPTFLQRLGPLPKTRKAGLAGEVT